MRELRCAVLLAALHYCCAFAQESAGQADVGIEHYSLTIGSERVSNVSGLSLKFAQFLPNLGILSGSFAPALSDHRFRTGDDYLRLKGVPWFGHHWTFSAGDFRLPSQLLAVPFTNLYYPEIAGRGGWIEANHGERTFGFFYGGETISNTPRVPIRLRVPQTVFGSYIRQQVGSRLLLGARVIHYSNDLVELQRFPNLVTQSSNLKSASTASLDAMYTISGPLKWYGEATWSRSEQALQGFATRSVPVSILSGPILETTLFTFRANYTLQNSSYLPLLGYYLGDRQGPFAEARFRPFSRLEIFSSASQYTNNVAKDPSIQSLKSSSESVGASLRLPSKVSFNSQLTFLDLSSFGGRFPSGASKNRQLTATVSRPFGYHHLRFTARDFRQVSQLNYQRQRSGEIEDLLVIKRLVLGAGLRAQSLLTQQSRTASLFYHGSAQFSKGAFSAYANIEIGNDLANRTLFATSAVSTTVAGASLSLNKHWDFQAEAYRSKLVTDLNRESIFALQGQGVFVPGVLAGLNQWSVYFRISRRFYWGKLDPGGNLDQYAKSQNPLRGAIEGFVFERGTRPAEGIPVSLDQDRTVTTDAEGRFHFAEVGEGSHRVGLAMLELPADFDPGKNTEGAVIVRPNKLSRADFDVIRLASIQGKVKGPKDAPLISIVIRTGERYTTPDADGNFSFYNLREGPYELVVDQTTLPQYSVVGTPNRAQVNVSAGILAEPVSFSFEILVPEKPVRRVFEKK